MNIRPVLLVLTAITVFSCTKSENESGSDSSSSVINAVFSVSDTHKVRFAPSNLLYKDGNYSFALYQYNYGDYFGWGTGNNPSLTSTNETYYQDFYDWGYYIEGGYRTLTVEEWEYLLYYRDHSLEKIATGSVNGTHGLIILPDNWTLPEGSSFLSGYPTTDDNVWSHNEYNIAQWQKMESAGAVFLAAAGHKFNTSIYEVGENGTYWTSSLRTDNEMHTENAIYIFFTVCEISWGVHYAYSDDPNSYDRSCGRSVRLVQDVAD